MSFNIKLQRNNSENNKLTKDITDLATLTGTLRAECSIIDPIFLVEADISELTGCNYCSVESFGRSYFVKDIMSYRTGLVQLSCHVDVLSSFATEIRANRGIVVRGERSDVYNLYLNDGSLKAYQDPYILTKPFPSGFTGSCFILAVAGG